MFIDVKKVLFYFKFLIGVVSII